MDMKTSGSLNDFGLSGGSRQVVSPKTSSPSSPPTLPQLLKSERSPNRTSSSPPSSVKKESQRETEGNTQTRDRSSLSSDPVIVKDKDLTDWSRLDEEERNSEIRNYPDDLQQSKSDSPKASTSASVSASTSVQLPSSAEEMKGTKDSLKSRKELEEMEREKMQVLVSNFTENQLDRYEMYRRAAFPKAAIKRLMQTITGNSVTPNVVIAMSGIAKVFVGGIVEEALDVMDKSGEVGPVQPKHVREAVRKLRGKGMMPNSKTRRYTPYPF